MSDYQIANDGTIFHIKEDGSISKLGKIENDVIMDVPSTTTPSDSGSGKGALVFFLVLFAIATLVLGILYSQLKSDYDYSVSNSSSKITSLERKIKSLEGDLGAARNERDAAKRELDNIGQIIPLVISDIEIANTDYDGNFETNYGSTIYSSSTMYLKPRIHYIGVSTGNKTLYVKLYRPDGYMSTGKTSPSGYSFSTSIYVCSGQNTAQLSGWGNSSRGHWSSGTYRIEVWYNNSCLKSKSFTVY